MAESKTGEFNLEIKDVAEIAKVLSHPARIQILKILTEMNVCMCGDIVSLLPLAQSTVSQHLKELKRVGLITGNIDGPKVCYCVNHENLLDARTKFENIFNQLTASGVKSCSNKMK